jgi:hypothetical protein
MLHLRDNGVPCPTPQLASSGEFVIPVGEEYLARCLNFIPGQAPRLYILRNCTPPAPVARFFSCLSAAVLTVRIGAGQQHPGLSPTARFARLFPGLR